MLFNSYAFLFAFLPLTWTGHIVLLRRSECLATCWLAAASLFFYGWWDYRYLPLLLLSVLANFYAARRIARCDRAAAKKRCLATALTANLLLLVYYKYAALLLSTLGLPGRPAAAITLPIGISFFTFTQIAYLVDCYRGQAGPCRLRHYLLFVSYFPHLIAGPLLHHADMMPQFAAPCRRWLQRAELHADMSAGLSMLSIGLAKKVLLADHLAPHAHQLFNSADAPSLLLAWGGVLAYSFQLYFDFSAYSDMAIGISRLFGIRLPLNFASPYKAANISVFWRRWHMTLSRFLRDYLYIPLGGNRHGMARRHAGLMITMVLGGLWHGAGWNFAIWGGLHGLYLMLHHAWRALRPASAGRSLSSTAAATIANTALTFGVVSVAWVFFRAPDLDTALRILRGMAGGVGCALPDAIGHRLGALKPLLEQAGWQFYLGGGERFTGTWSWVLVAALIAFCMPNTQQIMAGDGGWSRIRWTARPSTAIAIGLLASAGLLSLTTPTAFLYFQF